MLCAKYKVVFFCQDCESFAAFVLQTRERMEHLYEVNLMSEFGIS